MLMVVLKNCSCPHALSWRKRHKHWHWFYLQTSTHVYVRYMLSPICLLSVTFMYTSQPVNIFGNVSTPFGTLTIHWHPQKIYGDRPRGTPLLEGLNARWVAIYNDFGPIEGCISETYKMIGGKLVLITNRKSHNSFWLVPKLVTLNGVMAFILLYFTEFGSFQGALRKVVEDIPKLSVTEI